MQDYGGKLTVMLLQLEILSRDANPNADAYFAGQLSMQRDDANAHEPSIERHIKISASHRVEPEDVSARSCETCRH